MATHRDAGGYIFKTPAGVVSLQNAYANRHDTRRFERIEQAWSFYYGWHWPFTREDDEALVVTNYVRKFIDKKCEFLIGADFTLNVPKSLESRTLPKLLSVWKDNGRQALNYEIAQEGAVTGDVFVLITMDRSDPQVRRFDPLSQQRIVIQRLSSNQCYPVWDETKPNGRYGRPMRAFSLVRYIRRYNAARQEDEEVRYILTITPTQIIEQIGDDREKIEPNVLGEVTVVHIPNYPTAGSMFGMDDISDLIPLNKDHNEKSTDVSDSINYNSSPITVIIGAKAKNLERSPRAIWAIPNVGATVTHLQLEGELEAANTYLDRTKDAMHDIAGVPKSAFGNTENMSGTSGVALAMTLQPLIDERNRKRATYEPGYERINYFILRYAEKFHDLRLPFGLCEKCGGKIAIFYVQDPDGEPDVDFIQVRRCYRVDPDTLGFLDPKKSPLPVRPLIADPPITVGGQNLMNVPEAERGDYGEQDPNIPEEFDLPLVEAVDVDAQGNDIEDSLRTIQYEQRGVTAIPIDCNAHSYLNPFATEVLFNDTFPKDKKEQMDLLTGYLTAKVISRAYFMQQIGIENIDEMLKAVDKDLDDDFERQMQLNLALNALAPAPGAAGENPKPSARARTGAPQNRPE
jgi:hypothetical protein